jgi:tetratricopeptide (TPR) repeat protein
VAEISDLLVDEALWRDLRTLFDWQEQFSLVLLYWDDDRSLASIRRRLVDVLRLRTRNLKTISPKSVTTAVEDTFLEIRTHGQSKVPVWMELHHFPDDSDWNHVRDRILARMNEQRAGLERDVPTLLVVILPMAYKSKMPAIAPDLWSVRAFSKVEVPTTPRLVVKSPVEHEGDPYPNLVIGEALERERFLFGEWSRIISNGKEAPSSTLAADIIELALERGDRTRAQLVAEETLKRWRSVEGAYAIRDLSVSLNNVGAVKRYLGHFEASAQAYRESLELCRRLVRDQGETAQALRDLSVSLSNIGAVERTLGHFEASGEAYRESLEIFRRLVRHLAETPQALRDLSVLLDNVGKLERYLGHFEASRQAYRESLELCRRLVKELGETPIVLEDLSTSLSNIGELEKDLGHFKESREAYRESLELCRRLVKEFGETPKTLSNLNVALNNVGEQES